MVLCPEDLSSRHGSHLVKFCLTLIVLPSLPHPPHNRIKTYAPLPPTSTSTIPSTRTSTHPTPSAPGTLTSLPSPRPTAVDPSMASINVSRPLPCEEKGIQIGLGVIAPCLFVSVWLNCFLYVRLKKSESTVLFDSVVTWDRAKVTVWSTMTMTRTDQFTAEARTKGPASVQLVHKAWFAHLVAVNAIPSLTLTLRVHFELLIFLFFSHHKTKNDDLFIYCTTCFCFLLFLLMSRSILLTSMEIFCVSVFIVICRFACYSQVFNILREILYISS